MGEKSDFAKLLLSFQYDKRLDVREQQAKSKEWLDAIRRASAGANVDPRVKEQLEQDVLNTLNRSRTYAEVTQLISNAGQAIDKASEASVIADQLDHLSEAEGKASIFLGKENASAKKELSALKSKAEAKAMSLLLNRVKNQKEFSEAAIRDMERVIKAMRYEKANDKEREKAFNVWRDLVEKMIAADPRLKDDSAKIVSALPSKSRPGAAYSQATRFVFWQMLTSMESKVRSLADPNGDPVEKGVFAGKAVFNALVPFMDLVQKEMINTHTPFTQTTLDSFEKFMKTMDFSKANGLEVSKLRTEIERSILVMAKREPTLRKSIESIEKSDKKAHKTSSPHAIYSILISDPSVSDKDKELLRGFFSTIDREIKSAKAREIQEKGQVTDDKNAKQKQAVLQAMDKTESVLSGVEIILKNEVLYAVSADTIAKGDLVRKLRSDLTSVRGDLQRFLLLLVQVSDTGREHFTRVSQMEVRLEKAASDVKSALISKLEQKGLGVEDRIKILSYLTIDEVKPDQGAVTIGSPFALTTKEIKSQYGKILSESRTKEVEAFEARALDLRKLSVDYQLKRLREHAGRILSKDSENIKLQRSFASYH